MLDDLQELSQSYEAENRQAIRRGHQGMKIRSHVKSITDTVAEIPYANSTTQRKADMKHGAEDPYDQGTYQNQSSFSMAGPQPGYLASSRAEYPPVQAGSYPGPMYPQGPNYTQGPSYGPGPNYPSATRSSTQDSYNPQYGDPYRDESPRPSYPAGRPREIRVDPRIDPRDPRLDPRADPRGVDPRAYPLADPRMDPRDIRDPRPDTRMMSNYSYPVTSPADVPMRGYVDDYGIPTVPLGRGGGSYAPPSRIVPSGYDSRESPQMRDAYRHEPIREERRNRR